MEFSILERTCATEQSFDSYLM